MKILRRKTVTGLLVALALVAASCGGDDASDTTADAPLATTTEAPATTAAPTTVATFDLVAAVADYAATIPEGYMAVGDTTAFKDAVAASNALVIDVRETGEYAEGHILDAINIPLRTLGENLEMIPADTQVFVYCKSGWRAGLATSSLRMLGYDNVLAYPPGWNGWTAAGEEISTGTVAAAAYEVPEMAPEMYTAVNDFLTTLPEGWLTAGDVETVKAAIAAGSAVIDVRTPAEYAEGFIAPATNITLREIGNNVADIPTDTQVIAYCKSGWRVALSVPVFHILGFDNVRGFSGSYLAWTGAGEPIETQ
ncbi:MAG: hypothetical protein GY720_18360 [bacterium]|nr:hypothetical protein [bacterium]